jgi:hypothetical protein
LSFADPLPLVNDSSDASASWPKSDRGHGLHPH